MFKNEMDARADGHAVLRLNNYCIPSTVTTYEEKYFSVNDLVDLGLYENAESSTHVIGFEFLLDENNVKYVHHMVVYGHFSNANSDTSSCQMWTRTPITAWAQMVLVCRWEMWQIFSMQSQYTITLIM